MQYELAIYLMGILTTLLGTFISYVAYVKIYLGLMEKSISRDEELLSLAVIQVAILHSRSQGLYGLGSSYGKLSWDAAEKHNGTYRKYLEVFDQATPISARILSGAISKATKDRLSEVFGHTDDIKSSLRSLPRRGSMAGEVIPQIQSDFDPSDNDGEVDPDRL